MKYLALTLGNPAADLACDEALIDEGENGAGDEVLRFWEPQQAFVVAGYANARATEVNLPACAKRGIPVFRRSSGGGTVLQAPGCLNYALVLRFEEAGPLGSITGTNRWILERHRTALEPLLGRPIEWCGSTDLAVGGLKFSGNSQRRKRRFLLFHGTFLLNMDLALIEAVLHRPSREPDYRAGRGHREFLTNLQLPAAAVKDALRQTWQATTVLDRVPFKRIEQLTQTRYAQAAWNEKF